MFNFRIFFLLILSFYSWLVHGQQQYSKIEKEIVTKYGKEQGFEKIDSITPIIINASSIGLYEVMYTPSKNTQDRSSINVIVLKKQFILQKKCVGCNDCKRIRRKLSRSFSKEQIDEICKEMEYKEGTW